MRLAYRLLSYLATPLVFAYFLWRSRSESSYRRDWAQRLGYTPATVPKGTVWIHAASVGEVQAIAPVVADLLATPGTPPILVTTMTPAGRERLREHFGERVHHSYLPLDLAGSVRRFLARTQPRLGVLVEMELWPELLGAARQRGVILALVNARLAARTFDSYHRVARLFQTALAAFHWIAAQTPADLERLAALGAPRERMGVTGNLKFDQPIDEDQVRDGERLRQSLGSQRPVWTAASTRDGEESLILEAHATVRQTLPDARLILVPRHPQRFEEVANQIATAGWAMERRSVAEVAGREPAVFLGDSMGEMGVYITAADMVFVGGSLVAAGGQNMLEPAALGRAVVAGPSQFNFAAVSELLSGSGALLTVANASELGRTIARLLEQPQRRARMAAAAIACVRDSQGARHQVTTALTTLLTTERRD